MAFFLKKRMEATMSDNKVQVAPNAVLVVGNQKKYAVQSMMIGNWALLIGKDMCRLQS